ncbi:DMT family transporter [Mucilaginibacter aquariorum]|uniref:DMT family transporter n=1 Tax=Mucilaginibacter aquariorum TaxID=2967225 RepID=A0ABT1SXH3_9SPHI|nr:DMT family transporter [Mucilaginibacter aquariorum]MCQ6956962.1 DMT family transporter [Mucilaginibacter aquariorum]
MLYVFLSICCSVIVSVLLKLAKRYQIDVFQAITWNYSMAILLTWFFFKPTIPSLQNAPIHIYLGLGVLLPLLFMVMATSVRVAGIVRTDVAQRLSLFIPLLASFLIFGDSLNKLKVIGLIIGFAAILCSIPWQKKTANRKVYSNAWIFLLIVFFGIGIIDILFKQVALFKEVPYTTSLFLIYILAFVIALIVLIFRVATKKTKFSWPHIMFGWILGVANFGNILFYLKAHTSLSKSPSTVFSAMNIGVIALGTLVGLVVFNERLSILNKVGVALAVIAIVVITIS